MLQSMGSQKVRHDLLTEQQPQRYAQTLCVVVYKKAPFDLLLFTQMSYFRALAPVETQCFV